MDSKKVLILTATSVSVLMLIVFLYYKYSVYEINSETQNENAISPSNSFYIPHGEYEKVEAKASDGDVDAIRMMWLFHSIYRDDDEIGFEWLVKLANAGEIDAQELVTEKLANSISEDDREKLTKLQKNWRKN